MTIEEEIFKKTKADFDKIIKYGFKLKKSIYKYSKNIMNNTFRIDVEINNQGIIKTTIYDLTSGYEYTNFRIKENIGFFTKKVKDEVENLLKDIKNNCFIEEKFIFDQSNRIANKIKEKYQNEPEFEWDKFPGFATFKNKDSNKWYALIMNIDKSKLDKNTNGEVEILNIKLKPNEINNLLKQDGFYPAYHMNKKSWISITLNDIISDEKIMNLLDESYSYTKINSNKNEWIVPANLKYFDIEKFLKNNKTITWRQYKNVKKNDTIFLYITKPYSSIMYKFKVTDIDIPYKYENIKLKKVIKITLLTKYEKDKLSLDILKKFGIKTVRGPRYMPKLLSKYINNLNN